MMLLSGSIGAVFSSDGQNPYAWQVAGLLDWELTIKGELAETHERTVGGHKVMTCRARRYWVSNDVPAEVHVKLCGLLNGGWATWQGEMQVVGHLGDVPQDEVINGAVELQTLTPLEYRETKDGESSD